MVKRSSTLLCTLLLSCSGAPLKPPGPAIEALPDCEAGGDSACSSSVVIWQGFQHAWKRTFAGFSIPHRISRLDSFVDGEGHVGEGPDWRATANFHFGQNTGVDGNFMTPRGRYAALHHPDLSVQRGAHRFSWTDDADGTFPRARSSRQQTIAITAPEDGETVVGVLQGFSLRTWCDDDKQAKGAPCNSDGMWPYLFELGFECPGAENPAECTLSVELGRAWTPNRGGLPPIAEKPFNDKLDFELVLHYAVLRAPRSVLTATPRVYTRQGSTSAAATMVPLSGFAPDVAAITKLKFELLRTGYADNTNHLGRYFGALDFGVRSGPDGAAVAAGIWVPATVVEAEATYAMHLVGLDLAGGRAVTTATVESSLCSNSNNAPFFSTWTECGSPDKGPERRHHSVVVQAAPPN